jgi:hypothetical protein
MNHHIVRAIIWTEYALGAVIMLWGVYLISGPLRLDAGGARDDLPGVFAGVLLLSFSLAIFIAARAMRRGGRRHWIEQCGVIVLCLGLFAVMWLSRAW